MLNKAAREVLKRAMTTIDQQTEYRHATPAERVEIILGEAEVIALSAPADLDANYAEELVDVLDAIDSDGELPEDTASRAIEVFCEFSGWDLGDTCDLVIGIEGEDEKLPVPITPPANIPDFTGVTTTTYMGSADTTTGQVLLRVLTGDQGGCSSCGKVQKDNVKIETHQGTIILCRKHLTDVAKCAGVEGKQSKKQKEEIRFSRPVIDVIHTRRGDVYYLDGDQVDDWKIPAVLRIFDTTPPHSYDRGSWEAITEAMCLEVHSAIGDTLRAVRKLEADLIDDEERN